MVGQGFGASALLFNEGAIFLISFVVIGIVLTVPFGLRLPPMTERYKQAIDNSNQYMNTMNYVHLSQIAQDSAAQRNQDLLDRALYGSKRDD